MTHADMAEAVEHAFMRDDAVGERKLVAGVVEGIGHGRFLLVCLENCLRAVRHFLIGGRADCKCPRIVATLAGTSLDA